MYAGSLEKTSQNLFGKEEFYSTASQQMFLEIIENSIDNFVKSNRPKDYYIDIKLKPREFTIKNNGNVFQLKSQKDLDSIRRVFSTPNTSSNYTDKTTTAGTNGIGAKLVCLTQQLFEITIQNNNKLYNCKWTNFASDYKETIVDSLGQNNFFQVHVKLLPLNTKKEIAKNISRTYNFLDLNIDLLKFYIQNIFYLGISNIFLNGKTLKQQPIQKLLQSEQTFCVQYSPNKNIDLQIYLLYKSQFGKDYSFINGLLCQNSLAFSDIKQQIKTQLNLKSERLPIEVCVIGFHNDIKYNEQIKDKMTTKFKDIKFDISKLKNFIIPLLPIKNKSKKNFYLKNAIEANNVTKRNSDCSLILTEGNSAASLFNELSQHMKGNFFDNIGLFPLRGKVKNTGTQDVFDVDNQEVKHIIQLVGFQPHVKYDQSNLNTLRYKSIIIASDYDNDGYHIKGLILNLILKQWPELLDLGFFKQFTTPIITADDIEFYQEMDFNPEVKYKNVVYLKGLGSIDKDTILFKNIAKNFNNYLKIITKDETKQWKDNLTALFNNNSENRKNFIINYEPRYIDHSQNFININDILTQQVVQYSFNTLERAIPCFMDGLKDSQRKIIYHATIHNFNEKVANFAADISKTYDYHHGETSLAGAVAQLAQSCIGTNNCPLIKGKGQFGNNWNPQEMAAFRYIYVTNSKWLDKLIKKEDQLLYKYRLSDDGKKIEPMELYPILPLFLINGVEGIASGWSSYIPCFKISDLRNFAIDYLEGRTPKQLNPYYNNYLGTTKFEYINNIQYFVNEGFYKEYQSYYDIYETTLYHMSKSKLFEDLKRDYDIFPQRISEKNIIRIQKSDFQKPKAIKQKFTFEVLKDKYLYKRQKMENMTLIQHINFNQIKPRQFSNVNQLFCLWLQYRLEKYIQRKYLQLKVILKNLIIQYNYQLVKENNMLDGIKNEEKVYNKLFHLTPFSKINQIIESIEINQNSIQNLENILNKNMKQQQSQDKKDYDYITDKSIKYFAKGQFETKELENNFNQLYNTSGKQLFINELKELQIEE